MRGLGDRHAGPAPARLGRLPAARLSSLALGWLLLAAGCEEGGIDALGGTGAGADDPTAVQDCSTAKAGCACAPGSGPIVCYPQAEGTRDERDRLICVEGTRRCVDGRWGACEDPHEFVASEAGAETALVDQMAVHQQCSECDRVCYIVIDELDPNDSMPPGVLEGSYQVGGGAEYLPGGGISLVEAPGSIPPAPGAGAFMDPKIYIEVAAGATANGSYTSYYQSDAADIYFLFDASLNDEVTDEILAVQAFGDELTNAVSSTHYVPTGTACASMMGDTGVWGAIQCMVADPAVGAGFLRDIPFDPYGGAPTDPQLEIPFDHAQNIDVDATLTVSAISSVLSEMEEAGDRAGSQIPALHSVVTGAGMAAGLGRYAVPASAGCAGADFGYPCFRDGGNPIVVLITPNPGHNTSSPAGSDATYDYDPSKLAMLAGQPGIHGIADANYSPASPYDLTATDPPGTDASTMLAVFEGSTAAASGAVPDVPAVSAGCGVTDDAPDAVYQFEVGSTADIMISAEGTAFASSLSIHSGPPAPKNSAAVAGNERLADGTAADLMTVDTFFERTGDTTGMAADYQNALLTCGAHSAAPDAAFVFSVVADTDLTASVDIPGLEGSMAIYAASDLPPVWPAGQAAVTATDNTSSLGGKAYLLPFDAANQYVAVKGDLSSPGISADYDFTADPPCTAPAANEDAIFQLELSQARTLRFDTEGSDFDTEISLHGSAPTTAAGLGMAVVSHTAADTHANTNNDQNPWDTGSVNNLSQTWEGDTTLVPAPTAGSSNCGQGNCQAAVYKIHLDERTTLTMDAVDPGGMWQPTISVSATPPGQFTPYYASISAGGAHTCATSGGQIYCWGSDSNGQLGNGNGVTADQSNPQLVVTGSQMKQVAAGDLHTCGLADDGRVFCWGEGSGGRLGNGANTDQPSPVQVQGISSAVQLAVGNAHSCALLGSGEVWCWGDDGWGQLGDGGGSADSNVPVLAGSGAKHIGANGQHSCLVLEAGGSVRCWGRNSQYQIGTTADDGTCSSGACQDSPSAVPGFSGGKLLALGRNHSCALTTGGQVWCWGRDNRGQLGDGTAGGNDAVPDRARTFDPNDPSVAGGEIGDAVWLTAGIDHTCMVSGSGLSYCWGRNNVGQLGNSSLDLTGDGMGETQIPYATPVSNAFYGKQITSSLRHTCVLLDGDTDGTGVDSEGFPTWGAMCWGQGSTYKLGDGSTADRDAPVVMQGGSPEVSFGDGGLDRATTLSCPAGITPPEDGCTYDFGNGSHYYFCNDAAREWNDAALACEAAGSMPAVPNDDAESAWIAARLDPGEKAWMGIRRRTDPDDQAWFDVPQYETTEGDLVWTTKQHSGSSGDSTPTVTCNGVEKNGLLVKGCYNSCFLFVCSGKHDYDPDIDGVFEGSWNTSMSRDVWANNDGSDNGNPEGYFDVEPSDAWGDNCVSIDSSGQWNAEPCASAPIPQQLDEGGDTCSGGLFGLLCFLGALLDGLLNVVTLGLWNGITGGLFTSLFSGSIGLGGEYVSPYYDQSEPLPYVCEAPATTGNTVTLDAGDYWVTVGSGTTPCTGGDYLLTIADTGSSGTDVITCNDDELIALDDNDSGASMIERSLDPGTYYVVVKSQQAINAANGEYTLTVRDVGAVPAAVPVADTGGGNACAVAASPGGTASTTFTATAGTTYYALVKGDESGDFGAYNFNVGDASGSSTLIACADAGASDGNAELTQTLGNGTYPPGTYYAVLKGKGDAEAGDYRLTFGGAVPTPGSFAVPTYDDTVTALTGAGVRVATVLWCDDANQACTDASAQWTRMGNDTGGGIQLAAGAGGIPASVVTAVELLEAADTVTATLDTTGNPGFTGMTVIAVADPGDRCDMQAGDTFVTCRAGSRPTFRVSVTHPAGAPVPPNEDAMGNLINNGAYTFPLTIVATKGAVMTTLATIPVHIFPLDSAPAGTYAGGGYQQSFDSRGCDALQDASLGDYRPSWDRLYFKASVLPDTSMSFDVCAGDSIADLDDCDDPDDPADSVSGYYRALTVTAGTGSGDACADDADCSDGYCSPYTGICQYLEGATCVDDAECPEYTMGSCRDLGTAAGLGKTCRVTPGGLGQPMAVPSSALQEGNYRRYMRVKADMTTNPAQSRTPSLYQWSVEYHCTQPE